MCVSNTKIKTISTYVYDVIVVVAAARSFDCEKKANTFEVCSPTDWIESDEHEKYKR